MNAFEYIQQNFSYVLLSCYLRVVWVIGVLMFGKIEKSNHQVAFERQYTYLNYSWDEVNLKEILASWRKNAQLEQLKTSAGSNNIHQIETLVPGRSAEAI